MTTTDLALYNDAADRAAGTVIRTYSTSFALACRLLGRRVRQHVRNIYALVRVADEIVDGPGATAGIDTHHLAALLDDLEVDVFATIAGGFSANLVVHAFARTARECHVPDDAIRPFFQSMRMDLDRTTHDTASHDTYVYGSAEVIGVMCAYVFQSAARPDAPPPADVLLSAARRLGRAFQDVNFLRDLEHDAATLGRDYLAVGTHRSRADILDDIDEDLAAAASAIPALPRDSRLAVTVAHDLFAELARRLRTQTRGRVRVPAPVKLAITLRAAARNLAPQSTRRSA